jgi:phage terminase large subunit-like protein
MLAHLCGPCRKPNAQMFSSAQSRDQASLIFHLAAKMVRMSPILSEAIQIKEGSKELVCPELGTVYRALSAEATTAFGLSPSFIIHDELGQVKGPRYRLYEALETATGAQISPLSIIISTQAPTEADLLSILIDDALSGEDPRTIVSLYTAPTELDPFKEETIRLANPAMGNFLNPIEIMAMAEDARRMPAREAEFRNLILNQRVDPSNPFIDATSWQACSAFPAELDNLTPIYGGLDLSAVRDLTALVLIGKVDDVWQVLPFFWLPGEGIDIKSREDRLPYDMWAKKGFLRLTPGPTVTYKYVAQEIKEMFERYNIRKIGFDRWAMGQLKPWLIEAGMSEAMLEEKFMDFGQGTKSMTPALRALQEVIAEKKMAHGNNPVLTMCAANATVEGTEGNRKLSKMRSRGRIDGMVALAMAIGVAPLSVGKVDLDTLIA